MLKIAIERPGVGKWEFLEIPFEGPYADRMGNFTSESLAAVENFLIGKFGGGWESDETNIWIDAAGKKVFVYDTDEDGKPLNSGVAFPCFG